MIQIKKGDLISGLLNNEVDVIVHGCNCFNTMGAGIALSIKHSFYKAYEADLNTIKGGVHKFGTISAVEVLKGKYVINAYTQYYLGRFTDRPIGNLPITDSEKYRYEAIQSCLNDIQKDDKFKTMKIGFPKIGCGISGLNWERVEEMILDTFIDRTVYVYII